MSSRFHIPGSRGPPSELGIWNLESGILAQWGDAYNRSVGRRIVLVLIPLLAAGVLGGIAGSASTGLVRVPRVSELETYRPDIITEIRANDGSTIARYAIERRILVSRAEIPAVVRNAIIATEDKNFFRHGGVDVQRTVSALLANLRQKSFAQ